MHKARYETMMFGKFKSFTGTT